MHSLLVSIFNLSILIFFLTFKLRKPSRDFVSQRHEFIRGDIHSVREQLIQAQRKYDEFSAKLQSVGIEILGLREQVKQDIQNSKLRIMTEAERLSQGLISDARESSASLFLELKNELYSEMSLKALDRAEQLLRDRLTGDDRSRIHKEFSSQLEAVQ